MSAAPLILCYHAVASDWPDDVAVDPRRLARQLALLERLGYRGVTFSDAVSARLPGRVVAVTFDDAFHSVLDRAFPLLERHGWPGTVFAVSDYAETGRPAEWPRLDAWLETPHRSELRTLTWDELSTLHRAGWEIGSHTCSHPRLSSLSAEQMRYELTESRQLCEERLGVPCRSIAYPYGDVDPAVVAAAREAGYETGAALPQRRHAPRPLEWPRVGVYNGDSLPRFTAKLIPGAARLREALR